MRRLLPNSLAVIMVLALLTLPGASSVAQTTIASGRSPIEPIGTSRDTVWVFEADFSDTLGDNAGWKGYDAGGLVGIDFWRGQYYQDFETGRALVCNDRPAASWMWAAVDPLTSCMVDSQDAWLVSPPITVSGSSYYVIEIDMWIDCPEGTNDMCEMRGVFADSAGGVQHLGDFPDDSEEEWSGDPQWKTWTRVLHRPGGSTHLGLSWRLWNPDETTSPAFHRAGMFLNGVRVGRITSRGTGIPDCSHVWPFKDWFDHELSQAVLDTARIRVLDSDSVPGVNLVASNDGGQNWYSYAMQRVSPASEWWRVGAPVALMTPGSVIEYYFQIVDGPTCPGDAPVTTYEFTMLPQGADILLVDKHGDLTPGDNGGAPHLSEYYYEQMLTDGGYEWDKYDVRDPFADGWDSNGPDSTALRHYETVIWFTNQQTRNTVKPVDQRSLIAWLRDAGGDDVRNLLLTGNDIGFDLVERGHDSLGLYSTWLASSYIEDALWDTIVTVGWPSKISPSSLRAGCPQLPEFDAFAAAGLSGAELLYEYEFLDLSTEPAGVKYTHADLGYQSVNLGFGLEYLTGDDPAAAEVSRAEALGAIMDYMGVEPTSGVGPSDAVVRNRLSAAYPNPSNPGATIEYDVKAGARVVIRVYNVAGRLVRTLLDAEAGPSGSGRVGWDGCDDRGGTCPSGVYFYRIEAEGFVQERKLVLLR